MTVQYHLLKSLARKQNRTKVDAAMSVAAVIHPLMAVPQIVQIYATKETAGLSLLTWTGWLVLGLVFLAYGLAHKLGPYILMQVLWVVVDILVIVGILIYG
jgi:uncharacterized protein with PQ loop repeat